MQGASKLNMSPPAPTLAEGAAPRQVVYLPSCVTRMMGPAASDTERASVHDKLLSLFAKAGYEVIYPEVRAPIPYPRRRRGTTDVPRPELEPIYLNTQERPVYSTRASGAASVHHPGCQPHLNAPVSS